MAAMEYREGTNCSRHGFLIGDAITDINSTFWSEFACYNNSGWSSNLTEKNNQVASSHPFSDPIWNLNRYFIPVIILVGLIGNLTSFVVFMVTHLRRLSSSVYLAALALADTGFLVQLFGSWLGYVRIFLIHKNGWCQMSIYLTYVCSFLSVWFVVSFTVERYIAVCYPLKRQDMCTVPRAKKVVMFLTLFALVLYSYHIWTSGVVHRQCTPLIEHMRLLNFMNNVDTFITLIIPSLSIFVMNIRIMCKIAYFYNKRLTMTFTPSSRRQETTSSDDVAPTDNANSQAHMRNRSQIKTTKMLLVVSSIFLLLNLPSHTVRLYYFITAFVNPDYQPSETLSRCQRIFNIIYNCNFSVNFFLYSLCGKNFRKALFRLFRKCGSNTRTLFRREYSSVHNRFRRWGSTTQTVKSVTTATTLTMATTVATDKV